jgi:hypothetical protein
MVDVAGVDRRDRKDHEHVGGPELTIDHGTIPESGP